MPIKTVIIERLGSVKELNVKEFKEDELFKRAGMKTPTDFKLHHLFELPDTASSAFSATSLNTQIAVYGKLKGKAGQENKYDFPPPIDNHLFFGNCILVKYSTNGEEKTPVNLSAVEWKTIYEQLFGGFEDLGDDNDDDDDEEERVQIEEERRLRKNPKIKFTKEGYIKDGMIVDDDEIEDDEGEDEYFDDDDVVDIKTPPPTPVKFSSKPRKTGSLPPPFIVIPPPAILSKKTPVTPLTMTTVPPPKTVKSKRTTKPSKPAPLVMLDTPVEPEEAPLVTQEVFNCANELTEEEYF
jgi:hypothetical protein